MAKGSRLRRFIAFIRAMMRRADDANIGLISAGVAFFGWFAIFPGLASLIAIFGLVANPVVVSDQLDLMRDVIPPQAYDLFQGQIQKLLSAERFHLTWATFLSLSVALWSARAGVAALMRGLNAAYGTRNRNSLGHVLAALLLTLVLIALSVVALLCVIVAPVILVTVDQVIDIGAQTARLIELTRWGVALGAMLLALGVLYRYGPNRPADRAGWVSAGALAAIAGWVLASVGFSAYLANFNRYNEIYGSIGAIIAVQMWMYISVYLVMLGAVLNAQLSRSGARGQQH